jgi:hypothetical protein
MHDRNEIRSGRRRLLAAALIVLGPVFTGFGQSADWSARPVAPRPLDGPLSPEEAPSSFKLESGLRVEMVAAACAVTVYRGAGLPPSYRGGAFSCDPTGNLVHFDRLEPRGATFTARPAHRGVEFVASTDNWFRPG